MTTANSQSAVDPENAAPHCEHCLAFAGIYVKGRVCCDMRFLAGMPRAMQEAAIKKVRREQGNEAADAFLLAGKREYTRIRRHRRAMGWLKE